MSVTVERLWRWAKKVEIQENGCWLWIGGSSKSWAARYGDFWTGEKQDKAHRFGYEVLVGPIPEGLTIDHLCQNTLCVNPAHLEAVTLRENILRGNSMSARHARRTHCERGHARTPENTYVSPRGQRMCRPCCQARERSRKRDRRKEGR